MIVEYLVVLVAFLLVGVVYMKFLRFASIHLMKILLLESG